MKRIICTAPDGLKVSDLTPEQQDGLRRVYLQFTLPMPGTIPHEGAVLVDGVVNDNFDPQAIGELELPLTILGLYDWDGRASTLTTLVPITPESILPFLPDQVAYDDEGEVTSTQPPEPHIPHNWSGWPQVTL